MIYANSLPLDVTLFPDNTSQVWKVPRLKFNHTLSVVWEFSHEAELLHIAQLKNLADELNSANQSVLMIKYLPYARQDKEISNETTFALRTFANILNSLNFDKVLILDPHSSIALDLINNSKAFYPTKVVDSIFEQTDTDLVCYPDNGAKIKYSSIYNYDFIYGEKIREQETGYITSYELFGDPKDKTILIVDDICDGGMTFKILTKDLLEAGAKEVNLFVTHGLFSKGLKTIKDAGINRIFTQDGEVEEIQNNITYRKI